MSTYLGPASELTLADGTVVRPGDDCTLDDATRAALEKTGHLFSDTAPANAPQSASENLSEEGLTPEQAAASAGLSVGAQPNPAATATPPTSAAPVSTATPPAPPKA